MMPTEGFTDFLPQPVINAIYEALDDEYKAYTTYEAYLNAFGEVRPFSNIIHSEKRHIDALTGLLNQYGISVPLNPYRPTEIEVPQNVSEACKIGVTAEIANRDLYKNKLIPAVRDYPDILYVFQNLQAASEHRHLPAFQRCASRRW